MTKLLITVCFLLAACTQTQSADLAIRGATVVDVTDGSLAPEQTVLIEGGRIVAVGPADAVRVPDGAEVLEAAGDYLIPGLWDMHVHSAANTEWHFPAFVALGITGVRNMHTTVDTALELTQAIKGQVADGTLLGPRFIANGPIVDGTVPIWPGSVALGTPAAGRAAVDSLTAGGADFIKVYQRLPRDVYFAIADHAKQRGIPFVGHVPTAVRTSEAADAGQRSIEHANAFNLDCSPQGDSIRAAMANDPPSSFPEYVGIQAEVARTWDLEHCASTVEALVRNGTWIMPSLAISWAAVFPDSVLTDTAAMAVVPPTVVGQWAAEAGAIPRWRQEADRAILAAGTAMVSALHRAGVPLLAGTDVGNPLLAPGYSLHKELELLVGAGLTPLEALRTATLSPVRFLNATDSLGTVATGKLADLVLLDANPLEDIRNTQRIAAVVLNGRYLDRPALDALLRRAGPYAYEIPPQTGDGWATGSAADVGLDVARLERMTDVIRGGEEYPNVHAVLIVRDGLLVYEEYFAGEDRRWRDGERRTVSVEFHRDTLHDLRSVGKSVTSALAGIALAEGALPSPDTSLFQLVAPGGAPLPAEGLPITLRHALTMSGGLDWNEGEVPYTDSTNHSERLHASANPVAFLLGRPAAAEPGSLWSYNSGLPMLIGLAVARVAGVPFGQYARAKLFEPLGITEVEWTGPTAWRGAAELRWDGSPGWGDVANPAGSLWLRPRDLAKFGALYLDQGRWRGRQVVPASWIRESTRRHIAVSDSISEYGEHGYGYLWWHDRFRTSAGPLEVHTAVGNGAQRVFVIPSLQMLVVHLAGRYNDPDADWMPERLLLEHVLPAVRGRP